MKKIAAIVPLCAALFSMPAAAYDDDPVMALPDGQAVLALSVTERKEVEQDLLVATLSFVALQADARTVQNHINMAMGKAVNLAEKTNGVAVSTGGYQLYEYMDPRTSERKWRGTQSITLKSQKADSVLEIVGKLQALEFTMNGLSYTLAPETAASVQDSLMEDALRQLKTRANRAAKALGKSSATLRDIQVQNPGAAYPHTQRARMEMAPMDAAAPMAAPVSAPGETVITLSVSARALLKP